VPILSLDGAPTTATLNFHTPFFEGRSGFGLNMTADRVGMLRSNSVEASYAYRFSVAPNFGLGIYYEQSNFYLGLSLPQLLNTSIYRDFDVVGASRDFRTYYLMTGYLATFSNSIKFQPGAMVSFNAETPFELDVNANFIFLDAFWVGANYRLGDAVSALVQYQFTPNFRVGTAFDFTMTELNSYSNGSVEVMLSYVFNKKLETAEQINHLRFF